MTAKAFFISVLLLGAWFLSPGLAQTNGGDIHFGGLSTGIPPLAAWILSGIGGVVFAYMIILWAFSYRRWRQRGVHGGEEGEIDEPE